MVQTLRAGRWSGYLRPELNLVVLADRMCQSMLHVGLDVIRHDADPTEVATVLCRIIGSKDELLAAGNSSAELRIDAPTLDVYAGVTQAP